MMILIGIILIFLGMGAYMINNSRLVSNDWVCMIGMTMDGTM